MITNVAQWLRGLGLEQYAAAFQDNDIDGEVLPELTSDDLIGLGVTSIGHRRKLLAAISAMREAPTPEGAPPAERTPSPAISPSMPTDPAAAERRQLTIMFCDVVGSTELATRLDPEDLREIIAAYQRRVSEVLTRFAGFLAKYMGDGILAYFGYPQAHEEDAEQAVRAGLAIVDAVGNLDLPQRLEVRLGIATGLVVVGDLIGAGAAQEQSVVGETANLAARLQALAGPNDIVIGEATRRQIGSLFEFRDLGPQSLKGFGAMPQAWQVLRESNVASRFEALRSRAAPLIGRDEEIELLLRRWTQAKAGEGRVVLLSAEPGIGKSRLTEAVQEHIGSEPHRRLRYFCSPHHRESALYPIIGQLERAAGFARDDDAVIKRCKLAALLAAGSPAEDDLPLLAELLSLPAEESRSSLELTPQRKKEKTFDALLRALEDLARQQPVLVVFEDLHWIDPTTRELLDRTIARVEQLPVLLIATFRPDFQPPWIGQAHVTMVALARLARRDGAALVRQLAGDSAALPADIVEEIIERTDGVPLFLEEVTKVVIEAAAGSKSAARSTVGAVPRARAAVPATLRASLTARLDRLGPAAREVAQAGAAIGREFSYQLLAVVAPHGEAETRAALDRLVAAGLVFQRGIPPMAEYQFKHALVQDTAYSTLLRGPRQVLHARIAFALQERSPEIVERSPEISAHHLTEAGELDSAATFWLEAGRRASRQSANIEAAAHLARGIAGLSGLAETPERMRQELTLQLALGPVLLSTHGFGSPEARQPYGRAADLAARLGDDRARFAATWGLWITNYGNGRLQHLGDLVQIANRVADPELSLQAHHSAWATRIWGGEFVQSRDHVRQGIALYDPEKHRHHALMYGGHDPGVCGKGQGAVALWALGYSDQGAQSAREGVILAEELRHVPSILHALWFAAGVCCLRQELARVRDCSERLLTLGREHGLKQYQAIGGIFHGWVLVQEGRFEEGLAELRSCFGFYATIGQTMSALFRAILAEAELRAGNFEHAQALVATDEAGDRWWWAEFLRLRGELHRSRSLNERAASEQPYREAIAVARGQQAKALELRAATGLASLWAEQGQRAEARELLAPVYGWFTEGFNTADLKHAAALLASLA